MCDHQDDTILNKDAGSVCSLKPNRKAIAKEKMLQMPVSLSSVICSILSVCRSGPELYVNMQSKKEKEMLGICK